MKSSEFTVRNLEERKKLQELSKLGFEMSIRHFEIVIGELRVEFINRLWDKVRQAYELGFIHGFDEGKKFQREQK